MILSRQRWLKCSSGCRHAAECMPVLVQSMIVVWPLIRGADKQTSGSHLIYCLSSDRMTQLASPSVRPSDLSSVGQLLRSGICLRLCVLSFLDY